MNCHTVSWLQKQLGSPTCRPLLYVKNWVFVIPGLWLADWIHSVFQHVAPMGYSGWERRSQACHFCNLEFQGVKRVHFPWERTFPGRKDTFIHCQWTSQPEFGQDNGSSRNIGACCNIERAQTFFLHGAAIFPLPLSLNYMLTPGYTYSHEVSVGCRNQSAFGICRADEQAADRAVQEDEPGTARGHISAPRLSCGHTKHWPVPADEHVRWVCQRLFSLQGKPAVCEQRWLVGVPRAGSGVERIFIYEIYIHINIIEIL